MNLKAPKNLRKKFQKRLRNIRGCNSRCNNLYLGEFGLRSTEGFFLRDYHFEMLRLQSLRMMRKFKANTGKIFFRVFPQKSFTKKPEQESQPVKKSKRLPGL